SVGTGGCHFRAPPGCEADGCLGGQHTGQLRRYQFPNAVSGNDADVVHRKLTGGEQTGRNEQGLCLRSVLDFVRSGLGAEPDEIDPGELGPPGEFRFGARQFKPGGEESRFLCALTRRHYSYDHI
ncbi:MAG: hypothetical protein ACRDQZ_14655, partial [Mycobacteriales bacterium]